MRKYKKAQNVVEFALIAPVIIMIFMFIVEAGFIINARITFAEAVKISLIKANQLAGSSKSDIKTTLTNSIIDYMTSHNFPDTDKISVDIYEPASIGGNETALIFASYKYHPYFNILNFAGQNIVPDEFIISSSQVINSALLQPNDYSTELSTADLNSFSTDASVLKNQAIDGMDFRKQIALLVGYDTTSGSDNYNYARLFNWWGKDLLPQNLAFNITTGHLEVKSPYYNSGNWFDTHVPYTWVLSSLGLTHAVYSRIDNNSAFSDSRIDLSSDTASGDISDVSYNDYLSKRAINLYISNILSPFGSFDPIKSGGAARDDIQSYSVNYNNIYVLKLFVPVNAMQNDAYHGYRYEFGLDSNGIYDDSGFSADIVSCYIDSDGDGIPDAWDKSPAYFDADGNGILDGAQSIEPIFISTYDDTLTIAAESGSINIAPPFKMDGLTFNTSTDTYAPAIISVNYGKNGSALYFQQSGTTYTRKMPVLTTLNEKEHFINGTSDGMVINLNKSAELESLNAASFNTLVKVIHK